MGNNIKKSYRLPLFPIAIFFFFVFVFNVYGSFSETFDSCTGINTTLSNSAKFTTFATGFGEELGTPDTNSLTNFSFFCNKRWNGYAYANVNPYAKAYVENSQLKLFWFTTDTMISASIVTELTNTINLTTSNYVSGNVKCSSDGNIKLQLICFDSDGDTSKNYVDSMITQTKSDCNTTNGYDFKTTFSNSCLNTNKIGIEFRGDTTADSANFTFDNLFFYDGLSNNLPTLKINNLKSIYCYNDTSENSNIYNFELNATDEENDIISYFTYWNNDLDNTVIVDDFNNPSYVMEENGWAFDSQNCSYKTDSAFLELNKSCNNVQMIKWLYAGNLNENIDIDFDAWTYYNSSNVYEIWNWHNEKVVGLKLASYIDNYELGPYTNFSYWNGTEYVYFGTSYYFGLFSIKYDMNTTTIHYCINGLDEPSYYDCNQEVYEELHGTTDNIPGKFYMKPTFNNYFNNLPYVVLDNLRYKENPDSINWQTYNEGDEVVHIVDSEGIQFLTVYVTDSVNTPEYREYQFPITFQGLCSILVSQNLSEFNSSLDSIIDKSNQYLDGIDNGKTKFNWGFWILLFVLFVYLLIQLANFEYALMLTGLCGFVGAYLISGDYVQMISSVSLIGFGITIIISRSFI